MKMTHLEALKILETTANEDRAWAMAQLDEGLLDGVTQAQWLAFARATLAKAEGV